MLVCACCQVDEEEMVGFVGNLLSDDFHLLAEYGTLLLRGAPGLPPDPAAAAAALQTASDAAAEAMKGKLSLRYAELAAEAEAQMPEEPAAAGDDAGGGGDGASVGGA